MKRALGGELLFEFLVFVSGVACIAVFWGNNILLASMFLVLYAVVRWVMPKENDLTYYVLGGVLGPSIELLSVRSGVWAYANPSFAGIPMWLPPAWGLAVVLVVRMAGTLERVRKK